MRDTQKKRDILTEKWDDIRKAADTDIDNDKFLIYYSFLQWHI